MRGLLTFYRRSSDPNAQSVQITGNFDNWTNSQEALEKNGDIFTGLIRTDQKDKLVFKFIINGNDWITSDQYKVEYDESGIPNNYVDAEELQVLEEFELEDSHASLNKVSPSTNLTDNKKTAQDTEDKTNLTQVLTSDSSFAAVSIPGSAGLTYENIEDTIDENLNSEEAVDDQFNTPTNSMFNSTVLSSPTEGANSVRVNKSQPNTASVGSISKLASGSGSTIDVSTKPNDEETTTSANNQNDYSTTSGNISRKDGLLSKFKSLFRS